jgi:hypothetical protein
MTITETSKGAKRETLAERFSSHLDTVTSPSDIGALVRSFELSLRAANKSPKTIKSYSDTVLRRLTSRALSTENRADPIRGPAAVLQMGRRRA